MQSSWSNVFCNVCFSIWKPRNYYECAYIVINTLSIIQNCVSLLSILTNIFYFLFCMCCHCTSIRDFLWSTQTFFVVHWLSIFLRNHLEPINCAILIYKTNASQSTSVILSSCLPILKSSSNCNRSLAIDFQSFGGTLKCYLWGLYELRISVPDSSKRFLY